MRNLSVAASMWLCLLPSTVLADSRLVLDHFSFFLYQGSQTVGLLPAGADIPIKFSKVTENQWTFSVQPSQLDFPEMTFPSGRVVKWRLSSLATGVVTVGPSGISCQLSAPLAAYVDGSSDAFPFPLTFTTESSSSSNNGMTATQTGIRLDPQSGFLQLVATGVSPETAPTAPGEPFYVVASGRVLGLPTEIASH